MEKKDRDAFKERIKKTLGKRINEYREQKNWTQDQLDHYADLGDRYAGSVERGESFPRLVTLICIANALKVSTDQLLVDVLDVKPMIKATMLSEKIKDLPIEKQNQIMDYIEYVIGEAST